MEDEDPDLDKKTLLGDNIMGHQAEIVAEIILEKMKDSCSR